MSEQNLTLEVFHYIYKITRTDGSGKYYIGRHSTTDLKDGYFGSGKIIKRSVDKHGLNVHIKEILEFLPDQKSLKAKEKEIVNEDLLKDPLCMNIVLGGDGDFSYINKNKLNVYGKNGLPGYGGENLHTTENRSKAAKTRWIRNRDIMLSQVLKAQPLAVIASKTPEAIAKRKATAKTNKSFNGEKNSQFGTKWVHDGKNNKKIKGSELDFYLSEGYNLGKYKELKVVRPSEYEINLANKRAEEKEFLRQFLERKLNGESLSSMVKDYGKSKVSLHLRLKFFFEEELKVL